MRGRVIAIIAAVCLMAALVIGSYGCSSCARLGQKLDSEYGYGVPRHIVLYSFDGDVLQEWDGVIDVDYRDEDNMADLLFFDGDRVVRRVILNIGHGQLVVESEEANE